MGRQTSFTYSLLPEQQKILSDILRQGNYRPIPIRHAVTAAESDGCAIAIYKTGKCLVQGRNAADFATFVLEPLVLRRAELGYDDVLHPELSQPHIGVDESGKGDYFGPLVVAGAYVDGSLVPVMREMDVKDSKRISSDRKALTLGRELRKLLGKRYAIVKIGPRAYNRLYARMRNVNNILGWAHARAIENLLEAVPDCPRAISDQFGNERLVRDALMKRGRRILLEQRHRAESNLAVAAASIIARETFLAALREMQDACGVSLPKGASAAVREAAVELAKKRGPAVLIQTVKCHFKTTDEVLKELKSDRSVLGPDGQAVSRPSREWRPQ
ncbi:MAG: ribonuclease HIII [Verrucomicrobiota bacterium]|nr:ribonuclease HIII [Verrucomicrobiota bacterium]